MLQQTPVPNTSAEQMAGPCPVCPYRGASVRPAVRQGPTPRSLPHLCPGPTSYPPFPGPCSPLRCRCGHERNCLPVELLKPRVCRLSAPAGHQQPTIGLAWFPPLSALPGASQYPANWLTVSAVLGEVFPQHPALQHPS